MEPDEVMNSQSNPSMHPSLRRTTAALDVVGARQGSNAFPSIAVSLLALALAVATIAAVVLG